MARKKTVDSDSGSDGEDEITEQFILERLSKYGDSLLEEDEKSTSKSSGTFTERNKQGKTKKKKSKKLAEAVEVNPHAAERDQSDSWGEENWSDEEGTVPVKGTSQLDKFKQALSLDADEISRLKDKNKKKEAKNVDKSLAPIVTAVARFGKKRPPPEIIVFDDPAKRKRKREKDIAHQKNAKTVEEQEIIELKRARWEVRRLGISGFVKDEKEEEQTKLLISLGAAPPKRPKVNYKELTEQRKKEKQEEVDKIEMMRKMGYKVSKAAENKRKKRDINDVGSLEGLGSLQKVSSKDFKVKRKHKRQ